MQVQKNIVPWKCHICARQFDTMGGGICKDCGKVTCNSCFGSVKLKILGKMRLPESQLCRSCADKKDTAAVGSKKK
jgi:hypothetical protein